MNADEFEALVVEELDRLPDDMVDGLDNVSVVRNAAKPLDREIRARRNGTPLWHWCIFLALAALLAETILLICSSKSKK